MGGHQTYPGQEIDQPRGQHVPTSSSPEKEYDQDFWAAGVTYMTFGVLNPPGGAMTPYIRRQALKAGFGQRAAMAIGLGGEWVSGIFIIGIASWLFDPLDLYEGGIIPDVIAQETTAKIPGLIQSAKDEGGAMPIDFQMGNWGSFQ